MCYKKALIEGTYNKLQLKRKEHKCTNIVEESYNKQGVVKNVYVY